MTTAPVISLKALKDAVEARLRSVDNVFVCVGEAVDVPLIDGSDGRVVPYVVLYPGQGTPEAEETLNATSVGLEWGFQVTAAAGEVDDLLALLTRLHQALFRWEPSVPGLVCGPLRPPPGYDPGPIPLDESITPHRPYLPLQYRCQITAT